MKSAPLSLFLASQLAFAAQPALAAELIDERTEPARRGAFAGARIRLPLGETEEKAHAGLALTSTFSSERTSELRFAKGLELGIAGEDKLQLSLGGTAVSRIAQGKEGPDAAKKGISTFGGIAIGVGIAAIIAFVIYGEIGDAATE